MVVAGVDFRTTPKDPYPAQVQDVNYTIRWWKSAAGGNIDLRMFEGMPHSFVITPQPESHVAIKMMKQFIAKQVNP